MKMHVYVLALILLPLTAMAQTNTIPRTTRPSTGEVVLQGLATTAQNTSEIAEGAIDAGKALGGTIDKGAEKFVGEMGKYGDSAGAVLGAADAYRKEGAEGMAVYGAQELLDRGGEAAGEAAAGAYTAWRAGTAIVGPAAGALGLSFTAGTLIGDYIKDNEHIKPGGKTIETHVTNFWFNSTYGAWANWQYDAITSDESIERHRQKLRQQRFESMRGTNEQAATNRAAAASQQSANDNAGAMNELMLQLLPAAMAASKRPEIKPPYAAPAAALPQLEYRTRCLGDGRKIGSNEVGPVHCWQEPIYPGAAPAGRSAPVSAPLGSTFGSQPSTTTAVRRCQTRDQQPNFCRGNAECTPC